MSATFVGASTQYLLNSAPPLLSTFYPMTVGCWAHVDTNQTGTIWSYSEAGSGGNLIGLRHSATTLQCFAQAGGTKNNASLSGFLTTGSWFFSVCRFIASNNRKLAAYTPGIGVQNATTSTSRAPTGGARMQIGAEFDGVITAALLSGAVAEFWYTQTDIQPDAAALKSETLLKLAFGGPFSLPHIAKDILEYRSFRRGLPSSEDRLGEIYMGTTPQTWTNVAGATLGEHPPLPYWHVRPTLQSGVVVSI